METGHGTEADRRCGCFLALTIKPSGRPKDRRRTDQPIFRPLHSARVAGRQGLPGRPAVIARLSRGLQP
jgi:hypothetical protein